MCHLPDVFLVLCRILDWTMVNLEKSYMGPTALKTSYSWHTSVVRCVYVYVRVCVVCTCVAFHNFNNKKMYHPVTS